MNDEIHDHEMVALLEDVCTVHFETREPLTLRRGQVGTVVLIYEQDAYEVEFSDEEGCAVAMLSAHQLLALRPTPLATSA